MNAILAALVNGALLGAMLTAAIRAVLGLIPRRTLNAATRYVVWWLAIAIVIGLPAIYLPMPSRPPARTASVSHSQAAVPVPAPVAMMYAPPIPRASPIAAPIMPGPAPFPVRITASVWPRYIFLVWAAASLGLLARLALSGILLASASARAADAPAQLRAHLAQWLALSGATRRRVRLAASTEIAVPIAVGPRRPSILIPASLLESLDTAELDQIGLHEAAHLARRDDYALLFQRILEAVFALHPVVRYVARQIDLEREIACDDLVIHATGHPRSYATCLTRVVELTGSVRASLAATGRTHGASHLALRIEMLLDKTRHTGTRLLKARLTAMAAVIVALAWAAGHSPRFIAFASPLVPHIPFRQLVAPALAPAPAPPQSRDVEGRIVEDSSGNPLASAELRFHKAGQLELAANLETDRDGRFHAPGLAPGEYTVDLLKPNYITATLRLQAPSAGLVFRLVRYGVIDGIAADDTGARLPGRLLAPGGRTAGSSRIAIFTKPSGSDALQRLREISLQEGGRFRIFDLPPGNYAIGLFYSGLPIGSGMQLYPDNAHPRIFSVTGGEEYKDVSFLVSPRPAWQVSGKLDLPADSQPFALSLSLPEQPVLPLAQTLTEKDGSFRFEKVPAGSYDLFAGGPSGGYTAFENVIARTGEPLFGRTRVQVSGQNVDGVTVPLSPGRSFNVILHSASGAAGCPQTATVVPTPLEPWGLLLQVSAQANFTNEVPLRGLPPGKFRVAANLPAKTCYQANQPEVDLAAAQPGPVTIELAPAGGIHGTLRSGAAAPTGFIVVLLDPAAETQLAFPDAQGRFTFDGIRPGTYHIAAQPNIPAAGAKARWVSDISRMTAVEVPGGPATSIELPVTAAKGDRQ